MENRFIEKVKNIHKNADGTPFYDYSKVKYVKAIEKVIIICKKHGDFLQRPNDHYRYGCPKCGIEKRTKCEYIDTIEQFVKQSNIVHNNKYDYSFSIFINLTTKLKINCPDHGVFEQQPNDHLSGMKCKVCAGVLHRRTTNTFIRDATLLHGDTYDYSKTKYTTIYEAVIITCKIHGDFMQKPVHHLTNKGCHECGKIKNSEYFRSNTEEFIEKSIKIHGDKYDYSQVEYKTNMDKINIICKVHGLFMQTPCGHLGGRGCNECGYKRIALAKRGTLQTFIQKAKSIYGDKYDYSKVDYVNSNTYIIIICNEHGEFKKRPCNHISSQQGCPKCQIIKQYSKMSIDWLQFCEKYYNISIQHAENYGEYSIPNSRYKADGYCKETNTIFEFHGSRWHGDPLLYKKNSTIFFGTDYGTLYENTIKKETFITDNGYKLIVMWESKWKKINRYIKIFQKQYRRLKCKKV